MLKQHVGRVRLEAGEELLAGPDDGDALVVGVVAHHRVGRGDEHDVEAVLASRLGALLDQRLVADEHATDALRRHDSLANFTTVAPTSRCRVRDSPRRLRPLAGGSIEFRRRQRRRVGRRRQKDA